MTESPVGTIHETGPKLGLDEEFEDTDRGAIYLDKTLVLVGCGAAKRDPDDPTDIHLASTPPGEPTSTLPGADTGPAWRAEDLYTSSYFAVKRELAETVTAWARPYDAGPWAILSAEHGAVPNRQELTPYDTTIDDLGDDPTDPDDRVKNSFGRRRPDGQEIVTEMDKWAAAVAAGLCKWVAGFRDRHTNPWENDANTLLVLAGQDYIEPLRDRGVFEYGIARMAGDPNEGFTFPLEPRFLFEEIDAGGIGDQMAWLSDSITRLEGASTDRPQADQREIGEWTGRVRTCDACETPATETALQEFGDVVYCPACEPLGQCARCESWTDETGLGGYPLCPDCQTDRGGMTNEPLRTPERTEQTTLTRTDR